MKELQGKTIILGVTGSISAFKAVGLASRLTQAGACVEVIATQNALKLATTAAFEGVTHRKCHTDTFAEAYDLSVSHVTLGTSADLVLIAPASADIIAKIAHGIADDKLSTTMLAVQCPVLIAPAMNCYMFENPAVQENLRLLQRRGMEIIDPAYGNLACGYSGKGRMPDPEQLLEICAAKLGNHTCLKGKHILVTAGPTREYIDAVRYISNPSTGKMGFACARAAERAGAKVTLIAGPCALPTPYGVERIDVVSAKDMECAVTNVIDACDAVIMAAAVSDFRPKTTSKQKIHKTDASSHIELEPTTDILAKLGSRPNKPFLCGFCMETDDLLARAKEKRLQKNADMIVANSLSEEGAGFACDTNIVTILTQNETLHIDKSSKEEIAARIIDFISSKITNM